MSNEQERAAFEAWLQKCHPGAVGAELIGKEENASDSYTYFGVNKQWRAWQARAAQAAAPAPAPVDPCLVLWQAMNEAEKVGNRTDDKLIVEFLRRAGYGITALAATPAAEPQPLTDEQIEDGRSKLFSVGNPYCPITEKAMRTAVRWAERAHGIGGDK